MFWASARRRAAALARHQTQSRIRKIDTSEAFAKFEAYKNGIDRLESIVTGPGFGLENQWRYP